MDVNILPVLTEIKRIIVLVYSHEVISITDEKKTIKSRSQLIDLSIHL